MKTLDIIIPYYYMDDRIAKYLCDCINAQDYTDTMTVYLISDASYGEESLKNAFKEAKFKYELLSTGSSVRQGPGVAKNIGLNNSSGDIVLFWDADDYFIGTTALNSIVNKFYENSHTQIVRLGVAELSVGGKLKTAVALSRYIISKYNFRFIEVEFSEDVYLDMFVEYIQCKESEVFNAPVLYYDPSSLIGLWNLTTKDKKHIYNDADNYIGCDELDYSYILIKGIFFKQIKDNDTTFSFSRLHNYNLTQSSIVDIKNYYILTIWQFCMKYFIFNEIDKSINTILDILTKENKHIAKVIKLFKESYNL